MLNQKKQYKKRVLFVGIPDMAYICLDGLRIEGVNIVGVVGPKKEHPTYNTFREFVLRRGLDFFEYNELTDKDFLQNIRALNADVAVVCSFNYKVPQILLDSVKDGFINTHPSLLPNYRGANPYSHAIINGEKETGVTLHLMDSEFDTGKIVEQASIPINPQETMGTLFNKLNILGLELLIKTLKDYEHNSLKTTTQPEGEYKKAKILKDNELYINYNKTAEEIDNFIRGLNPFIIASTNFRSTYMKVFSAEVFNCNINHPPGTIVKIENDKFYIATTDGLIAPSVVQFGNFFLGSSKDFIRMLNPQVGELFT